MSTPAPAVERDGQQSHLLYVAPTDLRVAHLLPDTWTVEKGRRRDARPSLCRVVWTARWRLRELVHHDVVPCTECHELAGLVRTRPPVQIVPPAGEGRPMRIGTAGGTAVVLDPQGEYARLPGDHRAVRDRPFLRSITHHRGPDGTPGAGPRIGHDWAPPVYVPEPEGDQPDPAVR